MGLFRPIWMTDRPKKALRAVAAVEKVRDPGQLKEIALSAVLPEVKWKACAGINDPDVLAEIAKADEAPYRMALRLVERLAGQDEALMSVALAHPHVGCNELLTALLDTVEKPEPVMLSELALRLVSERVEHGKWYFFADKFDRVMDAVAHAACRSATCDATAAALIEACFSGWSSILVSKPPEKAFRSLVDLHTDSLRALGAALPGDPESQRRFIGGLDTLCRDRELHGSSREVLDCCMLIESLRPYAYDIHTAVNSDRLYCDLTSCRTPDARLAELDRQQKRCATWKASAQRLILLSARQPEVLVPVWDILEEVINNAAELIVENREIGTKTVFRKEHPDDPEDWVSPVEVPVYEKSTNRKPMELHFPAARRSFP